MAKLHCVYAPFAVVSFMLYFMTVQTTTFVTQQKMNDIQVSIYHISP